MVEHEQEVVVEEEKLGLEEEEEEASSPDLDFSCFSYLYSSITNTCNTTNINSFKDKKGISIV